jgi:hypothetical protein
MHKRTQLTGLGSSLRTSVPYHELVEIAGMTPSVLVSHFLLVFAITMKYGVFVLHINVRSALMCVYAVFYWNMEFTARTSLNIPALARKVGLDSEILSISHLPESKMDVYT